MWASVSYATYDFSKKHAFEFLLGSMPSVVLDWCHNDVSS